MHDLKLLTVLKSQHFLLQNESPVLIYKDSKIRHICPELRTTEDVQVATLEHHLFVQCSHTQHKTQSVRDKKET